jgi:hypothetical protein
MLKILSPENICKACSPKCTGLRDGNCEIFASLKAVAQAQAREDAKRLLESQTSLTILDPLGGPKEAWISIKMPWEDYEAMKKAAEGGE